MLVQVGMASMKKRASEAGNALPAIDVQPKRRRSSRSKPGPAEKAPPLGDGKLYSPPQPEHAPGGARGSTSKEQAVPVVAKRKVGRPKQLKQKKVTPLNTFELSITVSVGGQDIDKALLSNVNTFIVDNAMAGKCSLEQGVLRTTCISRWW